MGFKNREEAALELLDRLGAWRGRGALVLGIPRGGVPMAAIIADGLGGDLDVALVRKLRAPRQPELAIGAVDEEGRLTLGPEAAAVGADEAYIRREAEVELELLRRRRRLYTPGRGPISPTGRVVIVVDDGSATGSTMLAALRSVRSRDPARLIAALGVASSHALRAVEEEADEVVGGHHTDAFSAVGEFYADFSQVGDDQVEAILRDHRRRVE